MQIGKMLLTNSMYRHNMPTLYSSQGGHDGCQEESRQETGEEESHKEKEEVDFAACMAA